MIRLPMVTRSEAKAICNIRDTNEDQNGLIDALVRVATEQIENATGRFFTKQEVTEFFPARQNAEEAYDMSAGAFSVERTRVRAYTIRLAGIEIDPDSFDLRYDIYREFPESSKVNAANFRLEPSTGNVRMLFATRQCEQAIRAVYTAGYEPGPDEGIAGDTPVMTLSDSLPDALKEACLLQVAYLHSRRRKDNIGLTGDRSHGKADQYVQTLSWSTKQGVTQEAIGLIRHLKRPIMGRY